MVYWVVDWFFMKSINFLPWFCLLCGFSPLPLICRALLYAFVAATEIRAAVFVTWVPNCTSVKDNSHEDTGWGRQLKYLHAKDLRTFPDAAEDASKTFP